jgi:spectinomycin phosphotransferase
MRTPPTDLDAAAVAAGVARGWQLRVSDLRYIALGGGSHHWSASGPGGTRYFLTVDDLGDKPWMGDDEESAFCGLRAAFATAGQLRERAGLPFILAPVSAQDGATVRRLSRRYTLTVFPFVAGQTGRWGDELTSPDRDRILRMLAGLHRATRHVAALAPARRGEVHERADLQAALAQLDRRWTGGPFAEPARRALGAGAEEVAGWLADLDRLAVHVAASQAGHVVTHGEPHGGNIMRVAGRFLLIDWDTVALAPPERDLWMLDDGTAGALAAYTSATGRTADTMALSYYRIAWRLADLAGCIRALRSAHQRDGNTERAWGSLQLILAPEWPASAPYRHVRRRG